MRGWSPCLLVLLLVGVCLGCVLLYRRRTKATLPNCVMLRPRRQPPSLHKMQACLAQQSALVFVQQCESGVQTHPWSQLALVDLAQEFRRRGIGLRLMVTPTGVVGWYDPRSVRPTATSDHELWVHEGPHAPFRVPHLQHDYDPNALDVYLKEDANPAKTQYFLTPSERYYFRTLDTQNQFLDLFRAWLPTCLPCDAGWLEHLNFYASGQGIVTNLHVDGKSGAIVQLKGRKRVYVFPARDIAYAEMYPRGHPLARRSRIDGRLTPEVVRSTTLRHARGWELVLNPGSWVFIPAGWLHYVESLDPETYSLILRFVK